MDIHDIKVGDLVITKTNKTRIVTNVLTQREDGAFVNYLGEVRPAVKKEFVCTRSVKNGKPWSMQINYAAADLRKA